MCRDIPQDSSLANSKHIDLLLLYHKNRHFIIQTSPCLDKFSSTSQRILYSFVCQLLIVSLPPNRALNVSTSRARVMVCVLCEGYDTFNSSKNATLSSHPSNQSGPQKILQPAAATPAAASSTAPPKTRKFTSFREFLPLFPEFTGYCIMKAILSVLGTAH